MKSKASDDYKKYTGGFQEGYLSSLKEVKKYLKQIVEEKQK